MLAQVAAVFGFDAAVAEDLEKLLSSGFDERAGASTLRGRTVRHARHRGSVELREAADEPDDHAIGRSRGGLTTKIHALTDQRLAPVTVRLTPDRPATTLSWCRCSTTTPRPASITACPVTTSACSPTRRIRIRVRVPNCVAEESNTRFPNAATRSLDARSRDQPAGRPPAFDAELYGLHNTVERGFNRLKQWRGVATRYDKYALTYLGGVLLACAVIHARVGATELGDTP
jgi:putative transposase